MEDSMNSGATLLFIGAHRFHNPRWLPKRSFLGASLKPGAANVEVVKYEVKSTNVRRQFSA
jgi:hypothetical protein